MLIDMKAVAAGPPGTLNAKPGDCVDVPDELAALLLSGGYGMEHPAPLAEAPLAEVVKKGNQAEAIAWV